MAKKLLNYMSSLNLISHIFFSLLFSSLFSWLTMYIFSICNFLFIECSIGPSFCKINCFFFFWKGLLWHYNSDEVSKLQSQPNIHSIKEKKNEVSFITSMKRSIIFVLLLHNVAQYLDAWHMVRGYKYLLSRCIYSCIKDLYWMIN